MTIFHVAVTGSDQNPGDAGSPFATINHAAQIARPGDTVVVHEGEYREWVKPRNAGLSATRRITYEAAEGERVVIKGSEQVTDWTQESGGVWKTVVPNELFGDFNPYALKVEGDWVVPDQQDDPRCHLGDVYLNGKSFYEVHAREDVDDPAPRTEDVDRWTGNKVPVLDPEATTRVWFAEVSPETTTIWANFGQADPREELVEINVRRSVFYPDRIGIDYITVRGFEICQAATPWTPPTADQPGMIGPNWAKGWIIEDNILHDAKCSAISIGKEVTTGHNYFSERRDKPGYQYQLESVFHAHKQGWSKEQIGSHVIRNNEIYDCGQNGIVGHLGCVFSEIYGNRIYRIATKREFFGHEIGGIKLHAAIDTQIHDNAIHDCTLGIWLDWQTQGTRVSRNVMFDNNRDLFVEVSHGPYMVDHNIFASPAAIETICQGGAYVGNLVGGSVRVESVMDRATPYHVPHSTDVKGYAVIYGADDRWWGNIFIGNGGDPTDVSAAYENPLGGFRDFTKCGYGTASYDGHPASLEEFIDQVRAKLPGDHNLFPGLKQPAYVHHNMYLAGAAAYENEDNPVLDDINPECRVEDKEGRISLTITLPESFTGHKVPVPTTQDFERVRFADADFENPDGSPMVLDTDLTGRRRH